MRKQRDTATAAERERGQGQRSDSVAPAIAQRQRGPPDRGERRTPLAKRPPHGMSTKMRFARTMRTRKGVPAWTRLSLTTDVCSSIFSTLMSSESFTTKSDMLSPSGPTPISKKDLTTAVTCESISARSGADATDATEPTAPPTVEVTAPPAAPAALYVAPAAERPLTRAIGTALFSGVVGTTACLAGWQANRYQWKVQLIDERTSRLATAPRPLAAVVADVSCGATAETEFVRVVLEGAGPMELKDSPARLVAALYLPSLGLAGRCGAGPGIAECLRCGSASLLVHRCKG